MTNEEFAGLVHRAEALARSRPGAYRLRLVILGGLGYAFVWGLLLLGLGLCAAVLASAFGVGPVRIPVGTLDNLLLPIGAFVVVLAQALWVPLQAPQGYVLEASDFPRLFEMIEDVRRKTNGPRIHQVTLDDQFNASIVQLPRLGVFGWYRNYLTLGLPLMSVLSPKEFEAVVAHEYGHLAGSHGRVGTWIYRIRATWGRLLQALHHKKGIATGFVRGFFDWYAPFFNAYSFAMARANEYEADRTAAEVAGPEAIGGALVSISAFAPYVEQDFWKGVMDEAELAPAPSSTPFTTMAAPGFGPGTEKASEYLAQAMAATSDLADTHPSLTQRLASIGLEARAPRTADHTAAQVYLGDRLASLASRMDDDWRGRVAGYFAGRHEYVSAGRERLQELAAEGVPDDPERLREMANLLDNVEGRDRALPVYRRLLEAEPDDPLALCVVGFEELRAGDDAGIARIERGMSLDPDLTVSGCQAIRDHLAGVGRMEEADAWHARMVERHEFEQRQQADRDRIPLEKAYEPHGLTDEELAPIAAVVADHPRVGRAYFVRKKETEPPLYVLALTPKAGFTLTDRGPQTAQEIAAELTVPQDILTLVMSGDNKRLLKYVKKVEGARMR